MRPHPRTVGTYPAGAQATHPTGRLARRLARWLDRAGLPATLALFVALALWLSLVVPPFETPDELFHYAFVRHLAQGNDLPVQDSQATGAWEQQGSQAPLYYWLAGRLTAGINQDDFTSLNQTNPRANIGDPLFPGNKNYMLYSSVARPLTGSNLALHIARWFSIALATLTVWSVARTAALAFAPGDRRALIPPLLLATIPQFVFISAACTNDNLVIALSALTIYWLARLLVLSGTRAIALVEWTVLGVLLGLAALSKLQGLGLFIPAAAVGVAIMIRRRQWLLPVQAILPVALPPLLIAGWWYWRNITLYGDWTGLDNLAAINGLRTQPLTWDGWWLEFRGLRYSFWGLFGWFNILLPQGIYTALDAFSVAALAGIAAAPWLGRAQGAPVTAHVRWVRGLLALWAILSFALLVYWVLRALGSQGRLFFPAIGATVIWLVIGIGVWLDRLPPRLRAIGWGAPIALLLAATLYSAAVLLPSSYAAPSPLAALPASAQMVNFTYGDPAGEHLILAAIDVPDGRYSAGQDVPVTLYLTTAVPLRHDYQVFVQLLDPTGSVLGNVTTHPGWGRNPTSLWQPGALYADPYLVRVNRRIDPSSPILARIYTGFIHPDGSDDSLTPLTATNAAGESIVPTPAEVVLLPWTQADVDELGLTPTTVHFGDRIDLIAVALPTSAQPGQTVTLTLLWEATAVPGIDLAAFVHLLDAQDTRVAGYDRPPGHDRFPTRAWRAGDRIVSEFALELPADLAPGDYTIWTGLYPAGDGAAPRLPAQSQLHPIAHDAVQLGTLRVSP